MTTHKLHDWKSHVNSFESNNCNICEGGLAMCTVCGGAEASMPTDCPGETMEADRADDVQAGKVDYVNGAWVDLHPDRVALYFGCWDRAGHSLHGAGGDTIRGVRAKYPSFPWTDNFLDTALLKNGKVADRCTGEVHWTLGGVPDVWHAFFWWDRSVDRRANSHSGFYVRGFGADMEKQAFEFAKTSYPRVVSRQAHPLILQEKRRN